MALEPWHKILRRERIKRNWRQHELADMIGATVLSVSRWERGSHLPSAYFRVKLCAVFEKSIEELGFTGIRTLSPEEGSQEQTILPETGALRQKIVGLPLSRNPFFTGREEELQWLHIRLTEENSEGLRAFALSGPAGIGKTQVALEYVYRYASTYTAVFWLAAESAESFLRSLQSIAEYLHLPVEEMNDQTRMALEVQRWLSDHASWLLVADNLEDPDLLQMILSPRRTGALLMTTRLQALGMLAESRELPAMDDTEGMLLLLRRARMLSISTPELAPAAVVDMSEMATAAELVKFLEGLPLALDQAGAYLEETGCGIEQYLQRCRKQDRQLLAYRGRHGGAHPDSVTTTLRLALARIQEQHPAAAELLSLCTLLEATSIPEELFSEGADYLGPVLAPVIADAYQLDLALATLRNASLLSRSPQTKTLSMQRLVQTVLQDLMDEAQLQLWSTRLIRAVNALFPDYQKDPQSWQSGERLLGQALACFSLGEHLTDSLPEAHELLRKTGYYLRERGRWREVDLPLDEIAMLDNHWYCSDYPLLIPLLEGQAELYWKAGEYQQAERLYRRVLTLEANTLQARHPWYARTLNDLGLLYWHQGRYEEAEPCYQQALEIWEQSGPLSGLTIYTLCNMAAIYQRQGKYAQAEDILQKAIDILTGLPSEHPRHPICLNLLANVYRDQGRYQEAEPLYYQALHMLEIRRGRQDPETGTSLYGLATYYRNLKNYPQARAFYQQAIQLWENRLSREHPLQVLALLGLANIYQEQQMKEAEILYQRALFLFERLGLEHPETAEVFAGLANVYRDQGKYAQAEPLYQRALTIYEQRLTPDHPHLARTLCNLARFKALQQHYPEAELLYQRALAIQVDIWEERHCETADTFTHFAHLHEMQGNTDEAIYLYQRALAVRKDILAPDHPTRQQARKRLSLLLAARK